MAMLRERLHGVRAVSERESRALEALCRAARRAGATEIDAALTPRGLHVSLSPTPEDGATSLRLTEPLQARLRAAFGVAVVRVDFAERPVLAQPDPSAPARSEAASLAREWLARVRAMEDACIRSEDGARNIEGVHELRIAIRRCRAALRWLARCTRDARVEEVVGVLRTLGAAAGPVRDADVVHVMLKKKAPKGAARDAALAAVIEARAARERALEAHLRSRVHRAAMKRADDALVALGAPEAGLADGALTDQERSAERAGRSLQRYFDRELRRIHERLEGDLTIDEGYHDVRRQLRRVRDIIDVCGSALGARRLAWRARLQPIQSLLGTFNDVVSAMAMVKPAGEPTQEIVQWLKVRRAETLTELATPLAVLAALVIAR